jgi:hypothetical protein
MKTCMKTEGPNYICVSVLTYLLMDLSPSWGAANSAATQEIPSILWNPKVHYRVHRSPPLVPILSQINPIHIIPSYLRSILILSTHLRLGLPSGLLPSGFPTHIIYEFSTPSVYVPPLMRNVYLYTETKSCPELEKSFYCKRIVLMTARFRWWGNYSSSYWGGGSQFPRGVRNETSSSAQTMGSWVQISFKAWKSVHLSLCFSCPD